MHVLALLDPAIACETSWDQLTQKAVTLILSLEITPQVLNMCKMSKEDLVGMDAMP